MIRTDFGLEVPAPFAAPELFSFFARRAVDGVESGGELGGAGDGLRYARTLRLPDGPAALEVIAHGPPWRLQVSVEAASSADADRVPGLVRRLFNLDADAASIDAALAEDPAFAPQVARLPGMRVPGAIDADELIVRAIVGQQISVARARTHLGRVAAELGTPYESAFAGLRSLFPTAAEIAHRIPVPGPDDVLDPDRVLRLPRRSIGTVVRTCEALTEGTVGAGDLIRLHGIGPWTAGYVRMRVLEDPDTWLPGDVALVAGARALGLLDPDLKVGENHRVLTALSEGWRPWRAYAAIRLWRAAA